MNVFFEIDPSFAAPGVEQERLEEAVQATLVQFYPDGVPAHATVNVVITDAETIRQLNHQYLGINMPTDVLSFANMPDPDFPVGEANHLGDIVIAYPVVEEQAQNAGHTPQEELILLAVHGSLHLAGFDHDTTGRKEVMWAAQRRVMERLGLGHVQPTEE
jgi:probable rRNA maturation factor